MSFIEFPTELFAKVVENLGMGDLAKLMQVSKAYHGVVEPFLWSVIEMHKTNFHAKLIHGALCAKEAAERPNPPYDTTDLKKFRRNDDDYRAKSRAIKFIKAFSSHEGLPRKRQSQLGSLIKILCLPLPSMPTTPWACFEHFVNLSYLEISAHWQGASTFSAPKGFLSKLRVLKLRGYLPKAFVQWLLSEPASIEELQLAIVDRPVGSCLLGVDEWENPPPPENIPPKSASDEELARWESTHENLENDSVVPRALACLTPQIMRQFSNLRKIYLFKPSDGDHSLENYFSERSDRRILEEWAALVKATRSTLESITFDQRPVAGENEPDGTSNSEYMYECAHGTSYKLFVELVLPVLLEPQEFRRLRVVWLFGFEGHDKGRSEFSRRPKYPNDSVDIPRQLKNAFPDAEIRDEIGRRLLSWEDSGEIMSAGDVLECSNTFSSDSEDE